VIDDNVVPFDPLARGGMARRGAPDKFGPFGDEIVRVQCPSCACDLVVEAGSRDGGTPVLCARCETGVRAGACAERGAG
jgi:hypothetical protein